MAKIRTGTCTVKTKDGKDVPMQFISASELDGSLETCRKVGQALLDWLHEVDKR